MSKRVSILLNVDTRPVCPEFRGMWNGVRSRDFLSAASLINRRRFFEDYDTELCVHVDCHEELTKQEFDTLYSHADAVTIRRHSKFYRGADPFSAWNDISYLQTFAMARCEWVAHFDGDVAAFKSTRAPIDWMFNEVESGRHKLVCYPSQHSPHPCVNEAYQGKFWASTRFVFGRRDSFDLTALERCLRDNDWAWSQYGTPPVVNPWTESFLAAMNEYSVIYPPADFSSWAVFPWAKYKDGTLETMNQMGYPQIHAALERAGGPGILWDGCDSNLLGI